MNLSEMETKVREATNNEPWGASTSLMAQIAAGTYNYREREEILSFIFRRFTEKAANEWRQIYKSMQLLDYLIKNGSERIVDDVRANVSLIQMLKSFHYIDSKGRDQGINVRNRSKLLIALLNDDALVRSERKKARSNSKKFGGVSSAAFGGASSIQPGADYGDDDFNNRVYGDGGVYGARYDDPASAYNNGATGTDNFEEYDVEPARASKSTTGASKVTATSKKAQPAAPEPDLLGDLMDFNGASSSAPAPTNAADDDEEDFDDFQTAPSMSTNTGNITNNLANLYVSQPAQRVSSFPSAPQQMQTSPQANYSPANFGATTSGPAKPTTDAFSLLFSSAKTKTTHKTTQSASLNNNDFGGFSQSTQSQSNGNQSQQTSNGNGLAAGEIDLLSF